VKIGLWDWIGSLMLLNVSAEGMLPIVTFIGVVPVVAVKRPFHNIRQIANISIAIIVDFIDLAYKTQTRATSPKYFLPS
jgi:hypothetical protein